MIFRAALYVSEKSKQNQTKQTKIRNVKVMILKNQSGSRSAQKNVVERVQPGKGEMEPAPHAAPQPWCC